MLLGNALGFPSQSLDDFSENIKLLFSLPDVMSLIEPMG
jgi:hypothetical protein